MYKQSLIIIYLISLFIGPLILMLLVLSRHTMNELKNPTSYKVTSKSGWLFSCVVFLSFILFFSTVRFGRNILRPNGKNIINIWDLCNKVIMYIETIDNKYILFVHMIFIIELVILFLTLILIIKHHALKIYIYLHKYSRIVVTLTDFAYNPIMMKINMKMIKFSLIEGKYQQFRVSITDYYTKYGFKFVLLFGLSILFVLDLYFNDGTLIFLHKTIPCYIILNSLNTFYFFVLNREPRTCSIIWDAYYNFHNPRQDYMDTAYTQIDLVTKRSGIIPTDEYLDNFFDYKYNIYRVMIGPYETMEKHILTDDLTSQEMWERQKILRKIGLIS